MKILYITQFFYPERVAAAFRAYDQAKLWTESEELVTVLTGYPNFPTGKLFPGYHIKLIEHEKLDGCNIVRNKIIIKPNTSFINRLLSYISFPLFTILNMTINTKKIGKDYDIILATTGTIFAPIAGYFYSLVIRKTFVIELRDITYQQMLATGKSEQSLGYKIIKKLELFLCKRAAKVITVTRGFKEQLVKDGILADKIEIIPNGVNIEARRQLNCSSVPKGEQTIVFSYFGAFGVSQELDHIIKILSSIKLNDKKVEILLIGDGAEKNKLLNLQKSMNNISIEIKESMSQDLLEDYYDYSDFCIVSLRNTEFFKDTLPSKLFQIMARKKTILFFGPDGEAADLIRTANAGVVVTEKDFTNCVQYLSEVLVNLEKSGFQRNLFLFGENGLNYLTAHFDRKKLAEQYLSVLKGINEI